MPSGESAARTRLLPRREDDISRTAFPSEPAATLFKKISWNSPATFGGGDIGMDSGLLPDGSFSVGGASAGRRSSSATIGPVLSAIDPSGAAYAWGNNLSGQIGDGTAGTANNRTSPTPVLNLTSGVTSVAAGSLHGLAVQNGNVYAWGLNQYGQLGTTTNSGASAANPTPAQINGLSSVTAIAAGQYFSLAVTGGNVYAWGLNQYGQLGNSTNNGVTNTTPNPTPTLVSGVSGVTAIAAGQAFSLALAGGNVYAWGYNRYGQLGTATNNGSGTATPTPTQVLYNGAALSNVTAIAAGGNHSLALSGGVVYAWGYNNYGQLGNSTGNNSSSANPAPAPVSGLSEVTAIAAGVNHSLAVTGGGNVYAWGEDNYGQLGNGTTTGTSVANPTPYEVLYNSVPLSGIVAVAAGQYSSYALSNDGSLYVWGQNSSGQLGLGNTSDYYTPQHLLPPAGQFYQLVDSDANGSFALAIVGSYPVPEPATWAAGALTLAAAAALRGQLRRTSRQPFSDSRRG